jgi:1,5-anhydro-D-fructose reductase (1,5-anhydro-D-mannitol-forming)
MIRVAMVSFWHVHARDYARQASEHPATEIVAAWDESAERGHTAAEALGVDFYAHLNDMLSRHDIDGVIINTPTSMHHDVMIAAAKAGKHIFTEKVLAPTVHECNEILAAVEQAHIRLVVSLPRLNAGYTQAIKEIIDQNLLGEVTLVRTRLSHNGAIRTEDKPNGWLPGYFFDLDLCAGGALIDLGCHPMYLARLFLGMPERISATYGYVTEREVEDNAVALLHYPQGAIGIVEAGFVNRYSPFTIEAHGTEGSLLYGTPDAKLLMRSAKNGGQDWQQINLPQDRPSAFQQWVMHIQQGTTASENIQAAVDLTRLMEAANLSAKGSHEVRLDSLTR